MNKFNNHQVSLNSYAHSYGFTLTEVIVVIVIIAALALILVPNMLKIMPDDHNMKYKKAFYAIQEIVDDIASECQGMKLNGGEWEEATNPENVLSYCYKDDGSPMYLHEEICKRLNTIDSSQCTDFYNGTTTDVQTTDGMRWNLPKNKSLATNNEWGISGALTHVYVSFDGKEIKKVAAADNDRSAENGIYIIQINSRGAVIPYTNGLDVTERDRLLDSPTK